MQNLCIEYPPWMITQAYKAFSHPGPRLVRYLTFGPIDICFQNFFHAVQSQYNFEQEVMKREIIPVVNELLFEKLLQVLWGPTEIGSNASAL